eukprot:CAMPEP_0116040300 /NCGR_PEP_ID=MMETSP0321-20121206/24273_1 /TAXON_ID=163516 /ORGANISM="Leptocylindrus danicus var. danicus, Strain B650" /LENGTH=455 /DNA_ID=CAMNT_0003520081 /DNA_START=81 /DNA_END=1448 /DNA_ORIENTATION=+
MPTKSPLISVLDAQDHAHEDEDQISEFMTGEQDNDAPPSLSFDEALRSAVSSSCSTDSILNQSSSSKLQSDCKGESSMSLMEEMMFEAAKARKEEEATKQSTQRKEGKSAFKAGFKKGFLHSSPSAKSSKKNSEPKRIGTKKDEGGLTLQKGFLNKPKQRKKKGKAKMEAKKEETLTILPPMSDEYFDALVKHIQGDGECSEEVLKNEKSRMEPKQKDGEVITLHANADASLASLRIDEVQENVMDKGNQLHPTPDILLSPCTSSRDRSCSFIQSEVQEAMEANALGLLSGAADWATPDLIEKFANNPRLCKFLSDPKFMKIVRALEQNPKATFASLENEPELLASLNEFCSLMGDHFTKLDKEKQDKESIGPLAKEALERHSIGWDSNVSKEEQDKVNKILADRDLSRILMDPEMQVIIKECNEPGQMLKYMRDSVYGPKLRQLINAGLLKVEQ